MSDKILFYKQLKALSRDDHKGLKLKPVEGCGFAANTHWVPLAGPEFYTASRHYPIVFGKGTDGGKETVTPIALLGLEENRNDFVSGGRDWKAGAYIPAYVRRYPFLLAGADGKAGEFVVCFDGDFAGFNDKEGEPLFKKDGTDSDVLTNAVTFLGSFNNDMEATQGFVEELRKLDLLIKRDADIRVPEGAQFHVRDFLVVDEEKFGKLTGMQLAQLHSKGFLGWIFAHLMSLANLPMLLEQHIARKAAG